MGMVSIANVQGRLVEIRAASPLTAEEAEGFRRRLADLFEPAALPLVVCADLSALHILPPGLAADLLQAMRRDNPRLLRAAFLLPDDRASLELQFDRLLAEAGGVHRRCFTDPAPLERWLGAVLDKHECIRLGRFLGGAMAA